MVTCFLRYIIDPQKTDTFEEFGRRWIRLVNEAGGTHHGYFLPHEGADNVAYALFSFESLARYEEYRKLFATNEDFIAANRFKYDTGCVLSYDRTFLRPVFE
jgi:NIPSNAP